MLIGSKLPPKYVDMTYFSSGRAAFAFLVNRIKPRKVYLPTYTCWSLVSTMDTRFPDIEVEYYSVGRDLMCRYPLVLAGELLVFIHYFGHENRSWLPAAAGTILEDMSHSWYSNITAKGDYLFGSLRKIVKVGDGGLVSGFFNPVYEPSRKLDTWLRYEAKDWKDIREAENMIDRDWQIADISSQSLMVLLTTDVEQLRHKRRANEQFLRENMPVGEPLLFYELDECPLLYNMLLETRRERDSLKAFLAARNVFASIHWPTHKLIRESPFAIEDALWLEDHILSIPVSEDYNLNDMEYIVKCTQEWT